MECFIDYEAVGKKIRQARKSRRWTQAKLAEEIGCSTANVTNIEKAKTKLSLNMLVRIVDVLEVSADDIIGLKKATAVSEPPSPEAQLREMWERLSSEDAQLCRQVCVDFCAAFSKHRTQV